MTASFAWTAPLDPYEVKDYEFSMAAELTATTDTIPVPDVNSVWALSPAAAAAGLIIHASSHTTNDLVVWLKVDPAMAADIMFDGPGTKVDVNFTVITTGGRTFHRSGTVTIKHL